MDDQLYTVLVMLKDHDEFNSYGDGKMYTLEEAQSLAEKMQFQILRAFQREHEDLEEQFEAGDIDFISINLEDIELDLELCTIYASEFKEIRIDKAIKQVTLKHILPKEIQQVIEQHDESAEQLYAIVEVRCSVCGRKEVPRVKGRLCMMPQPDGKRCPGILREVPIR